jgi:hypothetical protein
MYKVLEIISSLFNFGTFILFFIIYIIFKCIQIWYFFNKWFLLFGILLFCLIIYLGVQ